MIKKKLQQFFKHYQQGFIHFNVNDVASCHHLPCTLNTPDKIVLLVEYADCIQEFNAIFVQLKAAKVINLEAKNTCYEKVSEQLYIVCIEWEFIDEQGDIFSDFTAVYHVLVVEELLKIVNVVSHELSNSLSLSQRFTLQ